MNLLIYSLEASKTMNMEIFGRYLMVYDQNLVYKYRGWFRKHETTIAYTHISKFFLTEGIFYSDIEVVDDGLKESIKMRFVPKRGARIAKFLIEEKVKVTSGKATAQDLEIMDKIEKYIHRLHQFKKDRKITHKDIEKRTEEFLRKIEKSSRIG